MMNITTPKDKTSGLSKLGEAIEQFETSFSNELSDQPYYFLVVDKEYNRNVCDTIEKMYLEAGWSKAVCKTSSEREERPGLTILQLWR